jgi:hypothetical protein
MLANDTPELSENDGQILHPGSRMLFRYWEGLRAERPAPSRAELDLKEIRSIVPDLMIIEKDNIRKSYRYRLAGTRVCDLFRNELTYKDAINGWDRFEGDTVRRLYDNIVTQAQPCLVRMRLSTSTTHVIGAEMICLPIQQRHSPRLHILAGLFPFRDMRNLGYDAIAAQELTSVRTIWTEHHAPETVAVHAAMQQPFQIIRGGLS